MVTGKHVLEPRTKLWCISVPVRSYCWLYVLTHIYLAGYKYFLLCKGQVLPFPYRGVWWKVYMNMNKFFGRNYCLWYKFVWKLHCKKNAEIWHRGCNFKMRTLRPLQPTLVKTGLRLDVTTICDFFPIPAFATIGNVRTWLITHTWSEHVANYTRPWTLSTGLLLSCEVSKLSSDSLGKSLLLWEIIHSISSSFTIHVIPHIQHQKLYCPHETHSLNIHPTQHFTRTLLWITCDCRNRNKNPFKPTLNLRCKQLTDQNIIRFILHSCVNTADIWREI